MPGYLTPDGNITLVNFIGLVKFIVVQGFGDKVALRPDNARTTKLIFRKSRVKDTTIRTNVAKLRTYSPNSL